MGGEQSTSGKVVGYHVLRVQQNSPASKAGLEAFFDFIVTIGNSRLNRDNENLKEILRNHAEHPVTMGVYSSKTQDLREITITPSALWGGQGLLGVSIRFCSFENANENVWHVVDLKLNSPAQLAGLQSDTDYIIGSDTLLHEPDDMYTLIESSDRKPLNFFVYNSDADACREITITPNSAWGGEGMLGCGLAHGYLHRIPLNRQFPKSVQIADGQENVQNGSEAYPEAGSLVPPQPQKDQNNATIEMNGYQNVPLTDGAPQPPLFSQLPSIPPFPAPPSINPDLLTGFPNMPPVSQPAATEQQAVSSTPKTDQTSASAYQSQAPVSYTPTSAQQYQQQPTSMTNTPPKPESVTPSAPMMPPTIDFSKLPPLNFPPGMNPPPMFSMNNPNIPHLMTTMQANSNQSGMMKPPPMPNFMTAPPMPGFPPVSIPGASSDQHMQQPQYYMGAPPMSGIFAPIPPPSMSSSSSGGGVSSTRPQPPPMASEFTQQYATAK
ncbi:Golgi reassembly-stacking protein 2-like [Symsagittifera roscoffensis]|uniref:Golgi reassembly-stacking protein 2-like n=1 Tax=Symsagittifera roscoffensis TaxID=84072 RepID=UPI00307C3DC2